MGTRSLTIINDSYGKEIAVLYRQYDGYPLGHGADLKEFLSGMVIVNGFNNLDKKQANGMECLAAQIVAHFKDGIGNFYLHAAGSRDLGEEYRYHISLDKNMIGAIHLKVESGYGKKFKIIYDGLVDYFNPDMVEE